MLTRGHLKKDRDRVIPCNRLQDHIKNIIQTITKMKLHFNIFYNDKLTITLLNRASKRSGGTPPIQYNDDIKRLKDTI